jgi:hypothetical protein
MDAMLSDQEVDAFLRDGFVHLREVVPGRVLGEGCRVLWGDLAQDPRDAQTWSEPVIRVLPSDAAPFRAAFDNSRLFAAFDQLVGVGRWRNRPHLGLFVARFPSSVDPGDTGWHIDSSYPPDDGADSERFDFSRWRINVSSRGRALLMLFLYSDIGPDDAPTRIRVGSHLDVPSILAPLGESGMTGTDASVLAAEASASRPIAQATGMAGDVYLCHPFLVHAAQPAKGRGPRLLAQPPLDPAQPLSIDRPDHDYSPVERAIRQGLHREE